jgi:DNA-directed RNA polymerase omega subunit
MTSNPRSAMATMNSERFAESCSKVWLDRSAALTGRGLLSGEGAGTTLSSREQTVEARSLNETSRPGKALGPIHSALKADIKNMAGIVEVSSNVPNDNTPAEWPGIISRFQLVILAAHRNKQLLLGAQPRIAADRLKRRNTSIALEELKRGLILFKPLAVEEAQSMA